MAVILTTLTIYSSCCLLAVYIYLLTHKRIAHNSFLRKRGCLPPRKYPHKDPILGLDLFLAADRSLKNGTLLLENQRRYEKFGKTLQVNSFGTPVIHTIEPENLKSILATQFDSFGFEELRGNVSPELWGKGILNSDGAFWAHSRALIRPIFNRTQIADFDSFRLHTDRLMNLLPRDGSTVDLQPLFKCYILDSSTQFLFGKSVDSQLGDNSPENQEFINAFEYASSNIGRHRHFGKLLFINQDRRWNQAVDAIH